MYEKKVGKSTITNERDRKIVGDRRDPRAKIAEHSIEKKQNKAENKAVQKAREFLFRKLLLNPKSVATATEKRWRNGVRILYPIDTFSIGMLISLF